MNEKDCGKTTNEVGRIKAGVVFIKAKYRRMEYNSCG